MSLNNYYPEPNTNKISAFGKGFKWEDGDLVIDPITKNPVMITGVDNLIQTIKRALTIGKGTNPFYNKIGINIKQLFDMQRSISPQDFYDYVNVYVQEAIASSTPYFQNIQNIQVARSTTQERTLIINITLGMEQNSYLYTVPISFTLPMNL